MCSSGTRIVKEVIIILEGLYRGRTLTMKWTIMKPWNTTVQTNIIINGRLLLLDTMHVEVTLLATPRYRGLNRSV